jgi:hypothetical protein
MSDGTLIEQQFGPENAEFDLPRRTTPAKLMVSLKIYDLSSDQFELPGFANGGAVRIHFAGNDLGKVNLDTAKLTCSNDTITMQYLGETLTFRRSIDPPPEATGEAPSN